MIWGQDSGPSHITPIFQGGNPVPRLCHQKCVIHKSVIWLLAYEAFNASVMDPAHIRIERAIAFLVDGLVLDSSEHKHLLECQQCRYEMVQAAFEELKKRRQSGKARE